MKHKDLILFTLISILITDTLGSITIIGVNINYSTYIRAILIYISIYILIFISFKTKLKNKIPRSIQYFYKLWLFWNIFNLIRGAFFANDYWGWKFLMFTSIPFSFIPLVFYFAIHLDYVKKICKFILNFVFPFGFLLIPLAMVTNPELYSRIMIPVGIFILFIPYLKPKLKLLVFLVAVTSVIVVPEFRTNIIKMAISLFLLSIIYFKTFIPQNLIRILHLTLFLLPLVLFYTGVKGIYNPFNDLSKKEKITITTQDGKILKLTEDSRTFLYKDVLASMKKHSSFLIGKGSSGSYHSTLFYNTGGASKGIRRGAEVGILNILLYYGIIGVILYGLLLFIVSYFAIYKSKNILSQILGLLIASRWLLSFIEEFTQYDLNFYFFWLIMGMVSTYTFRNMTDKEIKRLLRFA